MFESGERLVTLMEAEVILGVSRSTLRRWTRSGAMTCIRIGSRQDRRFRLLELQRVIDLRDRERAGRRHRMSAG
jgi:excisionase family DNA binding protein